MKFMHKILPKYSQFIPAVFLVFCLFALVIPLDAEPARLGNRLQPFVTDGCSSFPNGFPGGGVSWLSCCVEHDIAYWAGGSANERNEADLRLRECVSHIAGEELGLAMYLGVRIGGYAGLPTSWRWGYGWVIDRGYAPLNFEERFWVRELTRSIPVDREKIPLVGTPTVPERTSLTGDYCVDLAVERMERHLGRAFDVVDFSERIQMVADGWRKSLSFRIQGCSQPLDFTFLLLRRDACTTPMNELLARGRVRWLGSALPDACSGN